MRKLSKVLLCVGCFVVIIVGLALSTCRIIHTEGIINYSDSNVVVVLDRFEVGLPSEVYSTDKEVMEYAKHNDGKEVDCKILCIRDLFVKRFYLLEVDTISE